MIYKIIEYLYYYISYSNLNTQKIKFDYSKYRDILDYFPLSFNNQLNKSILEKNELLLAVKSFCEKQNTSTFIISLSGGIDSMVLISIIRNLGYRTVGVHINYNNREETKKEEEFLKQWCENNSIVLYTHSIPDIKRQNSKRSTYELETKNIRFHFYHKVLQNESSLNNFKINHNMILIGHHKDDIVENIFANVCRGRYILDLAVIKETNEINNITIARPMIEFYKKSIYEFAIDNNIPYFKDTTPEWSIRGKYRNNIYPLLEDAFSSNIKNNLLGLSNQSYEWNKLIMIDIIEPFLNKIEVWTNHCKFNVEKHIDKPLCFWNLIFMKIFYKYNKNCPSRKGIQTFMNNINRIGYVSVSKNCVCYIKNYDVEIRFNLDNEINYIE